MTSNSSRLNRNDRRKSIFFRNHEHKQNKIIIKVMFVCLLAYPLLLLGSYLHIFPAYNHFFLLELCALLIISFVFAWVLMKYDPHAPSVKYILLSTLETIIFIISINKNFFITISYLLVPILSSIYLDKRTSKISIFICYFVMVLSLYIRGITQIEMENKINGLEWFFQYGIGYTLEYILISSTLLFLSKNNNLLITSDYSSTKMQISSQTIITASFIELLNKSAGIDEFHPKRCSEYTKLICKFLRNTKEYSDILNEESINYIVTATLVHDIGLWVIPERILHKTTPLTELESQQFKLHTIQGEELFRQNMQNVDKKYMDTCCDVILYHHEQWNGQGYPFQITETAIPLAARIVHAANEIDKLTRSDFAHSPMPISEAIDIIKHMGGREIDPLIANLIWENKDSFIFAYDKIKLIM